MAPPLWLLLAVWSGVFAAVLRWLAHLPPWKNSWTIAAAPVLWMGFEFFRSEVWMLRFSWLTSGFALPAEHMGGLFAWLGVYGAGAVLMTAAALMVLARRPTIRVTAAILLPGLLLFPGLPDRQSAGSVTVAGLQFENSSPRRMLGGLADALSRNPGASLFILPEYSFYGPVPEEFAAWCRTHRKWLIAGGMKHVTIPPQNGKGPRFNYFNTAWVVGPDAAVVHEQAKSVPIQFFTDGLPAETRRVWDSPWGKAGICICYDQNYRRITDDLAHQGMQLLCIPTMDVEDWGAHQHELSMRLAITRAVEHGVPVIRVASSGISVITDAAGKTLATGSFPGQGEIVRASLAIPGAARVPLDRWPAEISAWLALSTAAAGIIASFRRRVRSRPVRN
jgi:apolipoprotein N-acyltransferase